MCAVLMKYECNANKKEKIQFIMESNKSNSEINGNKNGSMQNQRSMKIVYTMLEIIE